MMWTAILEWLRGIRLWTVISQTEGAALMRRGRFKNVLQTGFHWLLPVLDDTYTITKIPRLVDLVDQSATTEDGCSISFSGVIEWRVTDTAKALLVVDSVEDAIQMKAMGLLARAFMTSTYDEARDIEAIEDDVLEKLNDQVGQAWGVKINCVLITDFAKQRVFRLLMNQTYDGSTSVTQQ